MVRLWSSKICLNILKTLSINEISVAKFNWYEQLKDKLDSIDAVSLLNIGEKL